MIIGGEGDDIILGGEGNDVIRGDTVMDDDAALAYFAALTNYDDSQLSIDNSGMGTGGNDVLIGGDGIDVILPVERTTSWHQAMLILMGTAKWTPSLLRSLWMNMTSITKISSMMMRRFKEKDGRKICRCNCR